MICPPLRLALVTETYAPEVNGVAMTLSRLTAGLTARGHQVQVIRPRMPADYPDGCAPQVPVPTIHRPPIPIPGYDLMRLGYPSRRALRTAWRATRPDVVHVATEGPMGISALLAARDLRIPCTSSYHTNFDDYTAAYGAAALDRGVKTFLRRVHNLARCTMVPTVAQATVLRDQGYRGACVLSRGIDANLFHPGRRDEGLRQSWGAGPETLVLTTVGRLAAEKNLALAIRALAAVREQHADAVLVLVGAGPERPRLVGDGLILAGNRCACDLAAHYASADIFLFPSVTETYGNVLPEAMASGLACVGYNYAAASELVHHEHDGLVVPLGDEAAFLAAATRVADDVPLRQRLRRRAVRVATRRPWSGVVDSFERHIVRVLARRDGNGLPS